MITYVSNLRHTLVDDLNDTFEFRAIEFRDRVTEVLLLLEGENVVVGDRLLALLAALGRRRGFRLLRCRL